MNKILIAIICLYQKTPLASHKHCRFTPTCSEYAKECLKTYGLRKGIYLSIKRVIKCHPYGKYGYDPVPKKENKI